MKKGKDWILSRKEKYSPREEYYLTTLNLSFTFFFSLPCSLCGRKKYTVGNLEWITNAFFPLGFSLPKEKMCSLFAVLISKPHWSTCQYIAWLSLPSSALEGLFCFPISSYLGIAIINVISCLNI